MEQTMDIAHVPTGRVADRVLQRLDTTRHNNWRIANSFHRPRSALVFMVSKAAEGRKAKGTRMYDWDRDARSARISSERVRPCCKSFAQKCCKTILT